MRRLLLPPDDSMHLDILRSNIADAVSPIPCANWARGIDMQFATLGTLGSPSPFITSKIDALGNHAWLLGQNGWEQQRTWDRLHLCPKTDCSKGAKLCTYHHWLAARARIGVSLIMSGL